MSNTPTEQITKAPTTTVEHVKNPKRVEAGKRLAMHHKMVKENQKKEKLRNDGVEESNTTKTSWMPEMSLTTGLTLVGLTLTAADL